jgi:ABC-type transporter MlaC component
MQKEDQNQFQDQFDQYLYQSRHITTPVSEYKDDKEIIEGKEKMSNKVTVCVRLHISES